MSNKELNDPTNQTAEQQARCLLERLGVWNAQSFSAGELVELANLIAANEIAREHIHELEADIARLRTASQAVVDYLCVVHKFGTVVKP